MIAVRLRPGAALIAGLAAWEHDGCLTVPVVAARPAYGREEAERDGYIVGSTDAEREIAFLKRLRRSSGFRGASEAEWREWLRESQRFAVYAELEDWAEPPSASRAAARELTIDVAEWLVAHGWADPVEPDLEGLEAELGRWSRPGGDDPREEGRDAPLDPA